MALVTACLKQRITFSKVFEEKKATGDSETMNRRSKLKFIRDYNLELQKANAASAKSDPAEATDARLRAGEDEAPSPAPTMPEIDNGIGGAGAATGNPGTESGKHISATKDAGGQSEVSKAPPFEEQCRTALSHFGKNPDKYEKLSSWQRFCLICKYWHEKKEMGQAAIRDRFRSMGPEYAKGYRLPPNDKSARERVNRAVRIANDVLAKL
jgi:hypothetical protein